MLWGFVANQVLRAVRVCNGSRLKMMYYSRSCPSVHFIVRNITWNNVAANPSLAAKLLRLHYHYCFVRFDMEGAMDRISQLQYCSPREFVKFLYDELMERGKRGCCVSRPVKCWRHYLKGVSMESFKETEGVWRPLHLELSSDAYNNLHAYTSVRLRLAKWFYQPPPKL
ncbi:hypothetical protein RJ640_014932 [Escallonia rubra]|uniref:peroxidase n=1 Tax=Escallonia rubra TaxID=112253 RepID=A0AA88RWE9_9ASTE|nr:hypothetical protein RJ640_014932 [Escallonia rubra]